MRLIASNSNYSNVKISKFLNINLKRNNGCYHGTLHGNLPVKCLFFWASSIRVNTGNRGFNLGEGKRGILFVM
jgi:hypothetical protein